MMKTFKKHAVAMAVAVGITSLASVGVVASTGDPVIHFDTSAIPGSESNVLAPYSFNYDDFLISDDGATTITQTDTDKSGTLTAGDAFSEFTVVSASAFRLDGADIPSGTSGLNFDYTLVTTITLGGFVIPVSASIVDIIFTTGTGSMVYDESLNPLGGGVISTAVATLGDPVSGSCRINLDNIGTANPDGACVITFDFDSLIDGLFVSADAGDLKPLTDDLLRIDVNIDEVTGLLALLAGGYGAGCAGIIGDACTAEVGVTHNGSARHVVSAPGTIALFGLGLLAMARLSRRFGART